jgi:hypothetical protein
MSDLMTIDHHEVDELGRKYSNAEPIIREEMLTGMRRVILLVERSAKANAPVLSGNLRRSISHQVTAAAGNITATVSAKTPYARAIEEGRPEVTILPRRGKYLVFEIDGELVFARKVVQPARAAKPYLKPALTKNRAAIEREFGVAVPRRIIRRLGGS